MVTEQVIRLLVTMHPRCEPAVRWIQQDLVSRVSNRFTAMATVAYSFMSNVRMAQLLAGPWRSMHPQVNNCLPGETDHNLIVQIGKLRSGAAVNRSSFGIVEIRVGRCCRAALI